MMMNHHSGTEIPKYLNNHGTNESQTDREQA